MDNQWSRHGETHVKGKRVTIIVPVWNEEESIGRCLHSIVNQNYPKELIEVLVVDGISTDRTRQIVAEFQATYPFIKLLDNPKRIVSAAMNIGIHHAKDADVIVRVDGHSFLESDYIHQCVYHLSRTGAGNVGGLQRAKGTNYIGQAIAMTMNSPLAAGNAKFRYSAQESYVDTVYLGAFPREVFDRIGLFNETLARNQDYELNYRLRQAGLHVFLSPSIRSWYLARGSLRAFWSQYYHYGYWKVEMLRQHPRSLRPRQLVPPVFVLSLILTALGGLFIHPLALLFRAILGAYALLASAFTLHTAHRHGWRYLPILPLTFATMHLSWGLGFLWGLVRRPKPPAQEVSAADSAAPAREEPAAEKGVPGS